MGKKKTLKKYRNNGKWVECNYYPSLKGSIGDKNRIDWGDYTLVDGNPHERHTEYIKVKPKKHITTKLNEWNSKRVNPKQQIKVEELNNGVVPKKTLVEIGKGRDKRKIDISQYILK